MNDKKEIDEPPLKKQGEDRVPIKRNGLVLSLERERRFVFPFGFPHGLLYRRRQW